MTSYKVLPPYCDISSDYYGHMLLDTDITYSATTDDLPQLGTFQNLQTLVEVSSLMSGQQQDLAWEQQDGVRSLQAALNSQPAVSMAPLWDTHASIPKLEGLDTLDLSSATPTALRSSPSVSRPTILHQRNLIVTHPYSPPTSQVLDQQQVHYVNLEGELLHGDTMNIEGKKPRPKSREKMREVGEARPCKVCGEKAGKHSYYGGQVCPSCRAFFRRSVQSGYNSTYFCVKEGQCEVTLKTRKNCQYCRYKLCEEAGMKTSWVLTDEERKQKFEGRGKRKSGSEEKEDKSEMDQASTAGSKLIMSEEEMTNIQDYVRASHYWEHSKVNDMDTNLIRQIIRMVAFRANLDDLGQDQLHNLMVERTTRFANSLSEFQDLCPEDRKEILSNNISVVLKLKAGSFFHPRLEWTSQLSPLLGTGEVEKLDVKLRSLNVSGLDRLKLNYKQFFTCSFLQTEQIEMEFTQLLTSIGSWAKDEKEYILVTLVILFCPDMLNLIDRKRVEETQLKFATLLHKYLNNKHLSEPEVARSRFANGMQLVTKCKELNVLITNNKMNHELL